MCGTINISYMTGDTTTDNTLADCDTTTDNTSADCDTTTDNTLADCDARFCTRGITSCIMLVGQNT